MKWYDAFSNFYDQSLNKLYFESRVKAVDYLALENGMSVLDLACGTGANFPHLISKNKTLKLFGTDYSRGMLDKAQSRIDHSNWKNVHLFQADARNLQSALIENKISREMSFDRIICSLGFSVIPDWEKVLEQSLALLKNNGKIVIVDVYAEKRNLNSWVVEKFANADLNRKIWQKLKLVTDDFEFEYLPVNKYKVGGNLFVAVGSKK